MEELSIEKARAYLNRDHAIRYWATEHGGVYVPKNERIPSNPNLAHIPNRDITIPNGDTVTLMNPAYIIRQMFDEYPEKHGVIGRIISLKPLNPTNAPDDWERKYLLSFEKGENEISEISDIEGEEYLRLMQPMITEKGCLKCHAQQGYKLGDIRGGIAVSILVEPFQKIANHQIYSLIFFYSLILFLGITGLILVTKKYIESNKKLKKHASKLIEKDERLKLAIEGTRVGVWAWNVQTGMYITERWAQMIGYTLDEILPININSLRKLVHPIDLKATEIIIENHLSGQTDYY